MPMCSAGCAAFMGLDWRRIFKEHIFDTLYTCRLNPSKFRSYVFFQIYPMDPSTGTGSGSGIWCVWFLTMVSVPSKHLDGIHLLNTIGSTPFVAVAPVLTVASWPSLGGPWLVPWQPGHCNLNQSGGWKKQRQMGWTMEQREFHPLA